MAARFGAIVAQSGKFHAPLREAPFPIGETPFPQWGMKLPLRGKALPLAGHEAVRLGKGGSPAREGPFPAGERGFPQWGLKCPGFVRIAQAVATPARAGTSPPLGRPLIFSLFSR